MNDESENNCLLIKYNFVLITVHGEWSPWSKWSQCSPNCGEGILTRVRNCNNPTPNWGGRDCNGSEKLINSCYTTCQDGVYNPSNAVVAIHGGWSDWSEWSECSNPPDCVRRRLRSCTNPPPTQNGPYCVGESTEITKCHHNTDSIHSSFSKSDQICLTKHRTLPQGAVNTRKTNSFGISPARSEDGDSFNRTEHPYSITNIKGKYEFDIETLIVIGLAAALTVCLIALVASISYFKSKPSTLFPSSSLYQFSSIANFNFNKNYMKKSKRGGMNRKNKIEDGLLCCLQHEVNSHQNSSNSSTNTSSNKSSSLLDDSKKNGQLQQNRNATYLDHNTTPSDSTKSATTTTGDQRVSRGLLEDLMNGTIDERRNIDDEDGEDELGMGVDAQILSKQLHNHMLNQERRNDHKSMNITSNVLMDYAIPSQTVHGKSSILFNNVKRNTDVEMGMNSRFIVNNTSSVLNSPRLGESKADTASSHGFRSSRRNVGRGRKSSHSVTNSPFLGHHQPSRYISSNRKVQQNETTTEISIFDDSRNKIIEEYEFRNRFFDVKKSDDDFDLSNNDHQVNGNLPNSPSTHQYDVPFSHVTRREKDQDNTSEIREDVKGEREVETDFYANEFAENDKNHEVECSNNRNNSINDDKSHGINKKRCNKNSNHENHTTRNIKKLDLEKLSLSSSSPDNAYSFSSTSEAEDVFSMAYVTHSGHTFNVAEMGINVYIPPGAIPKGLSQEIFVAVLNKGRDCPRLSSNQTLLSPVIVVGPPRLCLSKPMVLSFAHCVEKAKVSTFDLQLHHCDSLYTQSDNAPWVKLLSIETTSSHECQNPPPPVGVELRDNLCHIMTDYLTRFCLIGETKTTAQIDNCSKIGLGVKRCKMMIVGHLLATENIVDNYVYYGMQCYVIEDLPAAFRNFHTNILESHHQPSSSIHLFDDDSNKKRCLLSQPIDMIHGSSNADGDLYVDLICQGFGEVSSLNSCISTSSIWSRSCSLSSMFADPATFIYRFHDSFIQDKSKRSKSSSFSVEVKQNDISVSNVKFNFNFNANSNYLNDILPLEHPLAVISIQMLSLTIQFKLCNLLSENWHHLASELKLNESVISYLSLQENPVLNLLHLWQALRCDPTSTSDNVVETLLNNFKSDSDSNCMRQLMNKQYHNNNDTTSASL